MFFKGSLVLGSVGLDLSSRELDLAQHLEQQAQNPIWVTSTEIPPQLLHLLAALLTWGASKPPLFFFLFVF